MPAAIQWRRLDTPGRDSALLEEAAGGWRLAGAAVFLHEHRPCGLTYTIECGEDWRTTSAIVSGHVGVDRCELRIGVEQHAWSVNGKARPRLEGCVDIDLGFSPATNLLPLRRLPLDTGESAEVTAAWLRFPDMELTPLRQIYTRETETRYRYESPEHDFVCQLETGPGGFVTSSPGLWEAEATS